ncbi:MAG TPA: lmo0937 family membrane protein [Candidatus Angelobacter sp.]|nr:lmo0937 family membrane protein [Candidatus Angelobacter sp.]
MLWTLFVILLVLWILGMVSGYTMGGFIHLLLILALVAFAFQLITGKRTAV